MVDSLLLDEAKRLRAIAQTGLAYATDVFDRERYTELATIAHRLLAEMTNTSIERVTSYYEGETGYPTPKVDTRAGVFRDNKILLVQEASDGCWALPGGWCDETDSPKQGAEREVLEEAGFEVRANKLVALLDHTAHTYRPQRPEKIFKLIFLCDLIGGEAKLSVETTGVEFFDLKELPNLSLGRTIPEDILRLHAHHLDSGLPTYFD